MSRRKLSLLWPIVNDVVIVVVGGGGGVGDGGEGCAEEVNGAGGSDVGVGGGGCRRRAVGGAHVR